VARTHDQRTITSDPRAGETIDVDVPTHESAVVEFESGAVANVTASFDAPGGSTFTEPAFELYGTEGTLSLPDPNQFGGPVTLYPADGGDPEEASLTHEYTGGRGAGVADLARAVRGDWSHRTSSAFAHHVFEILAGVRESSAGDGAFEPETSPARPDPLPPSFPDDRAD
jgi:predicted dehydrogenase